MTLTHCLKCGTLNEGPDEFCSWCGAELRPSPNPSSADPHDTAPQITRPDTQTAFAHPVPLAVAVDADGNLPLCPVCHKTKLIWCNRPTSDSAQVLIAVGITLMVISPIFFILFFIPALLGVCLWGTGYSKSIEDHKVIDPYCPMCKKFFKKQI